MNLKDYLEDNLPRYLKLLRTWVETNSFTANPAGVNKLAELTSNAFSDLGFSAEFIPAENPDFGNHLVMTRKGSSEQVIGLISHLDTVFPPEEEEANDFRWRVEGDHIYGPGTNDIKGGTLNIYMLLDALKKFAPNDFEAISWVILVNAAEETLSADFGALCNERLTNGIAALVFEAGFHHSDTFQLVTQRKGMATYHVKVEGKSSHAGSNHAMGANAIVQIAHTVEQIASLTDYENDLTFNIGVIGGGVVTNRVPHFAEARGEMRTFNLEIYHQAIKNMLALSNKSTVTSADGFPCTIDIEITSKMNPWPENEGTELLFDIWEKAGSELGYTVNREARGGLSDGNHIWNSLPTIDGLGPMGRNGHCSERSADGSKDQEFATKSSFIPKTILNFSAIRKLISYEVRDQRST
jgi:glutamate carboxypeptidase